MRKKGFLMRKRGLSGRKRGQEGVRLSAGQRLRACDGVGAVEWWSGVRRRAWRRLAAIWASS